MKVVGTKYGVEITKPWNPAMYDHNDKVAEIMKGHIFKALSYAYKADNEGVLRDIAYAVCGHRFGWGHDLDSIYAVACKDLDKSENYWLNQEYPWLVKMNYCPALEQGFVGY